MFNSEFHLCVLTHELILLYLVNNILRQKINNKIFKRNVNDEEKKVNNFNYQLIMNIIYH